MYVPPTSAPARAPDSLLLVTWNQGIGAGDLARLVRDARAGRLTGGARPRALVLLLQEAHRVGAAVPPVSELPDGWRGGDAPDEGYAHDIVAAARDLGMHLVYAPSMRTGTTPAADRGNAILSDLPLRDPVAIELPIGLQRRVAVLARLAALPACARAASVHLDNFGWSHPIGSMGAIRAAQARALVAALPADGALAVGGDLNTWRRETDAQAARILARALPQPRVHEPEWTAVRLGSPRKLDYLFFRGPTGWRLADPDAVESYGSDHRAVVAWLTVPAGTAHASCS